MARTIRNAGILSRMGVGALVALLSMCGAARADLQLCNRMSYVLEAAIGVEAGGAIATRGWFRIDPGQCRSALQGEVSADAFYLHARTLPLYGAAPVPQRGQIELCVGQGSFEIANARRCTQPGERTVRFSAVKPSASEQGLTANLAEEADYNSVQARDAGIQRLLVIAGYDATPIDGIRGAKTDAVLTQFLQDNKLPPTAAGKSDIFDVLIAAAQKPEGPGLVWCNDTAYPVMAAIGVEEKGMVTTRGWYRIAPNTCLRPDVTGQPQRLYSFAEAVDGRGKALKSSDRRLSWGGDTILCTRNAKFELFEQKDCALKGFGSAGFAAIDYAAGRGTTIRFK